MSELDLALADIAAGRFVTLEYKWELDCELNEIWGPGNDENAILKSSASYSVREPDVPFSLSEPKPMAWFLAFTDTFRKAISAVDRKLQGRVMSAISELSENPVTPQGNTRKPLSGNMKGRWRYRLGDYRLVYEPEKTKRIIFLLDFASRGGVYD
ncbi:type II toxin-antitoxin system RelE/ParE family toxin [Halomonas sp. M5N1S17]|uniref:type II toxin-antitoxin system RelE family toxin n=1 Tax=Halomonas alkalisoli TaxID=2907158 RepID=UPI001F2C73E3|nr:type II toxin-antitoxin system RelE/ParE family toxin [Halomonas alkalisoli]MCE9665321.1 type II toxin-antitoxin system RelE/ParE family toxin [Halomonas alkalisoli]